MKTEEKNKKNKMNTTERYEFNQEIWSTKMFDTEHLNTNPIFIQTLKWGLHLEENMLIDCINMSEDFMIEEFGKLLNYEINIVTETVNLDDIKHLTDPNRKNHNPYWESDEIKIRNSFHSMVGLQVKIILPKKVQDLKRGVGWKPKKWGISLNNYEWCVLIIHPKMAEFCNFFIGSEQHRNCMDYYKVYTREKKLCELGI